MEKQLWLIWKEPKERRRFIIGILKYENCKYTFEYVDPELSDAQKSGFDFFPGFDDIKKKYESNGELFANIESRLPNTAREDYLEILNAYDLEVDDSKMDVLEKTRGRLLTDNFEFVPAFDENKIEFEVAGTSHSVDIKKIKHLLNINDNLYLEREAENKHDEYAIKIIYKNDGKVYKLGYVPRYYSKELTGMLNKNIEYSAKIKKLNFESKLNDENITAYVKLIFNTKK